MQALCPARGHIALPGPGWLGRGSVLQGWAGPPGRGLRELVWAFLVRITHNERGRQGDGPRCGGSSPSETSAVQKLINPPPPSTNEEIELQEAQGGATCPRSQRERKLALGCPDPPLGSPYNRGEQQAALGEWLGVCKVWPKWVPLASLALQVPAPGDPASPRPLALLPPGGHWLQSPAPGPWLGCWLVQGWDRGNNQNMRDPGRGRGGEGGEGHRKR